MEHEEQQPKLHLPLLSQKGRSSAAGTQNIEIPPRVRMASAASFAKCQQLSPRYPAAARKIGRGEMNVRETPFHAGVVRGAGKRTASECLLPVMLKDERMAAAHSHLLEQDRETNSLYYYFRKQA